MNVLFTCVGRRNYLVSYFRNAMSGQGRIVGADASLHAPAMSECDSAIVVPAASSPEYIGAILKICRDEKIGLLCTLNDMDLPILSSNISNFEEIGVNMAVSSPRVVDICFDKLKTFDFLSELGIGAVPTYTKIELALKAVSNGEISFPIVVKPRWGSGSIGLNFASDESELRYLFPLARAKLADSILRNASLADWNNSIVLQPKLKLDEYGLDIINDFQGRNVAVFVKKKLRMRSGETDISETCDVPQLRELGRKLGNALGHKGVLDCDVFFDGENAFVLEMNPRFGGGYPFSQSAGADVPRAYLNWAQGLNAPADCFNFRYGEIFSKCDRLVRVS